MKRCTYLLPIRRSTFSADEAQRFAVYFQKLGVAGCEVIVVDGSPPEVFAEHHPFWSGVADHRQVDPQFEYLNDKVNGIHTGVQRASCEKILLADDDIRYTAVAVEQMCALLDEYEMVRPQNFLDPLPWWARLESARMLINRATLRIGDYPGTCAFRKSTMLRVGHYDGDVLFDNEEIIRHFAAAGASIFYAIDFFIQKRPPHFRKWLEQRPRQAYEDFALRAKTALFFALPFLVLLSGVFAGAVGMLLCVMVLSVFAVALACAGGARGLASEFIPPVMCLYAPLWIFERTLSTYWAVYCFAARGGYPFGDKLLTKGIGRDWVAGGKVAAEKAADQSHEH